MSRSESDSRERFRGVRGAPSNTELAERTARLEEKIDHMNDSVERIEDALLEEHEELGEKVDTNEKRVNKFWTIYRFLLFAIPLIIGSGGLVGYWTLF